MFKRRGDLSSVKIVDFGFARRVTLPSGSAAGGASGGRQSLLRAGSSLLRLWSGGSGLSGGDMSEEIRLDNNVAGADTDTDADTNGRTQRPARTLLACCACLGC